MRAAWYDRTGPAREVFQFGEIARPSPEPGEVLVHIKASGINPSDWKGRGKTAVATETKRIVPHSDGAGIIEEVGEGVPKDWIGKQVWLWNAVYRYGYAAPAPREMGTAAEYVALPLEYVAPLPQGVSFQVGACLGVPAFTAYAAVYSEGSPRGKSVLVQGGAGAVGELAVQYGLATGEGVGDASITATSGSVSGSTTLTVLAELTYPDGAPVSVTTADSLVVAGMTLAVNASALTGANTLYWNGSAESDGSFYIKAGSSAATLVGGNNNDTFDFTASGVVLSSADSVNGGTGSDTLKIGKVAAANALANVTNVETISFADQAAISLTSADSLIGSGQTLTVDASALTDPNSFTWNGSAETDGVFNITTGKSNATITGGSGNDTITVGGGTNTIDGGPGNDTINLSAARGSSTVVFSTLSGVDSISHFVPGSDTLKLIASIDGGSNRFVTLAGTSVSSGTTGVSTITSGHLDGNAGTPVVLVGLANIIPSDAALQVSLAVGGTNQLTLASGVSAGSDLLVLYSDGTNAYLVIVRLNGGAGATTFLSGQITVIDLATLRGVTSLASWSGVNFQIG